VAEKRSPRKEVKAVAEVMVLCPVCGLEFAVPEGKGEGAVVECPYCHVELVLKLEDGKLVAEEA